MGEATLRFNSATLRDTTAMAKRKRPTKTKAGATSENIARRWTYYLILDGFTPVSDFFLENYHRLGVTSLEAMFIIHLMRHKWDEKPPHPSFNTVAKRMGISAAAVRAHARSLEGKLLLNRVTRDGRPIKDAPRTGEPNRFDLTPLFHALELLYIEGARSRAKPPDFDEDEEAEHAPRQAAEPLTQVEAAIAHSVAPTSP